MWTCLVLLLTFLSQYLVFGMTGLPSFLDKYRYKRTGSYNDPQCQFFRTVPNGREIYNSLWQICDECAMNIYQNAELHAHCR